MEDPRLLRIILFGLILAALTIGYLIFTNRFIKPHQNTQVTYSGQSPVPSVENTNPQVVRQSPQPTPIIVSQIGKSSPAPTPVPSSSAVPSAYTTIAERTQGTTTLPKTGMPSVVIGLITLSALVSGWFLRKYPE